MAGERLGTWIGREVMLHVWKSDDLGTESLTAVLRGMDSFGAMVGVPQQHRVILSLEHRTEDRAQSG